MLSIHEMCMPSFSDEAIGFNVASMMYGGCRPVLLVRISLGNILLRTTKYICLPMSLKNFYT